MSKFSVENLTRLAELYPKPATAQFHYGTAGFRTLGSTLKPVMFRTGVLACLRSKKLDGKVIGVVITASHNPEPDNGVKLVDPRGEMLEASWEGYATTLANAHSTEEFITALDSVVQSAKIDLSNPARVVYCRDTRPTGDMLVSVLKDGLSVMGAEAFDAGVTTTPILHYIVRETNATDDLEKCGKPLIPVYYKQLSECTKKLLAGRPKPTALIVDCANGVGTYPASEMARLLADTLPLTLENTSVGKSGALNHNCGADYVKTAQKIPPSMSARMKPGQRGCSFDGDADRLMYYYLDSRGQFRMLDGDKIATLVAGFIVELVKSAGLEDHINVGIVQTSYANGSSTKYLTKRLPVTCVSTGVKYLHHAAEHYDIGVYFEANGHGTVLFSDDTQKLFSSHQPSTPAQRTALDHLVNLAQLINQAVGDALSDMLLVEVVLAHKNYTALEWDSLYADLPNRLTKVVVPDRGAFTTTDADRRLVTPPGLQCKIDELVRRYEGGRSFVRPSGTEDVVRVYAEAAIRSQADELAFRVAGLVYDVAGGDPALRPNEFL